MNHDELFTASAADGGTSRPPDEWTSSRSGTNPYADLKRIVKNNGLLDSQPAYFGGKIVLNLCLLAAGLALLPILGSTWLQLPNAVYLAIVFVQISFLAHDFGHRQFTFRAPWKNTWATLVLGNLLLGMSRQWWIEKHNEHHAHPNQMDVDPDVDVPLLAFEEEQAFEKRGLARFVVKYQAALIFPLSLLQSLSMLRSSVEYLASKKARRPLTETFLIVVHFALYFGLLFFFLEPLQAVLFVAVHRGLFGLFMVSVFAPNHKAMPLLEQDSAGGLPSPPGTDQPQRGSPPDHRLLVRGPQLPDRAPPLPEDAPQQAQRGAADHQRLLPTARHLLPRDERSSILPRDPAAPARGRRPPPQRGKDVGGTRGGVAAGTGRVTLGDTRLERDLSL